LVRNAVDHGIESAAERRAAGKPDSGRVTVTAALRGPRVEIRVSDDGRGLDLPAIAERLKKVGQPVPDDARELARNIFDAGISTASKVTQISGRGIGLDVVRTQLAEINSVADVSFTSGRGTDFSLSVPLTLTVLRAALVCVGDAIYAIDIANVERALRVDADEIRSIADRETLMLAGTPVPILTLAEALGSQGQRTGEAGKLTALVLSAAGRRMALIVDALDAEREMIVRSLGPRLPKVPCVTGGTILSNGRIVLILNAAELIDRAVALPGGVRLAPTQQAGRAPRKRLLVVDDSATIRALERSILEATGYDVLVATDGQEAWEMLTELGADLVVSDVEMPRMDGFALTEAIRGSRQFRGLPVVLVTAMENEADKLRGMSVGASAYHVKSAFDQRNLLATIERLL
jgi:two-component system chemotaxis sensor kinase CheA